MHFFDFVFAVAVAATVAVCFALYNDHITLEVAEQLPAGARITFVLAFSASILSLLHIFFHLRHYSHPRRQREIIRCLALVPIYCIDSLLAFEDRTDSSIINIVRDTYEAVAISSFFNLLLDVALERKLYFWWDTKQRAVNHVSWPFLRGELKLAGRGRAVVTTLKNCVLQYVVLNPLLTVLIVLFHHFEMFDESSWSPLNMHLYISIIKCISVSVALFALLQFYFAVEHLIHDTKPHEKFLSVKLVLFFCCWTPIILFGIERFLPIQKLAAFFLTEGTRKTMSEEELPDAVVGALDSSLTIFVMFLASIGHKRFFSFDDAATLSLTPVAPSKNKSKKGGGEEEETKFVLVHTSVVSSIIHAADFTATVKEVFMSVDDLNKNYSPTGSGSNKEGGAGFIQNPSTTHPPKKKKKENQQNNNQQQQQHHQGGGGGDQKKKQQQQVQNKKVEQQQKQSQSASKKQAQTKVTHQSHNLQQPKPHHGGGGGGTESKKNK